MAIFLSENSQFRGLGSVAGKVVDLGPYPGLIASSGDRVRGELFELLDPAATLAVLDVYEGTTSTPPLYERRPTEVLLDDGTSCQAWVYWYRGPLP